MEVRIMATSLRAARAASRCASIERRAYLNAISCSSRGHQTSHLHTSSMLRAIPYPHTEVHASNPPPPPEPELTASADRIQRRKKQSESLLSRQTIQTNPNKPATVLQKRFWKHVSVKEAEDGSLQVFLDTRPVRTANKNVLTLPKSKEQLAAAIALEWDLLISAQQALKHHYIPLTSLTSRAIDIATADLQGDRKVRDSIVTTLMRYFTTDTLLCWAPEKSIHDPTAFNDGNRSLRGMQAEVATPIISYLTSRVWPGVEINPVLDPDSILPAPQPAMTQEIIKGWISGLKPYELAGLERAVLASKSLLVAARLLVEWSQEFVELRRDIGLGEGKFGIEEAAKAASMEVDWQTAQWGEVDDTHDVEKEDLRRQLGGVVLLIGGESA